MSFSTESAQSCRSPGARDAALRPVEPDIRCHCMICNVAQGLQRGTKPTCATAAIADAAFSRICSDVRFAA